MYLGLSAILTGAMKSIFTTLFNTFIDPIVKILQSIFLEVVYPIIKALFVEGLYNMLKLLLGIVDVLQNIFDMFSGVKTVKSSGQDMYILDVFLTDDSIKTAFIGITLVAAGICMIFTIYSVGRSIGDNILENKHPVGEVLKQALKAMVSFLIIPFMMYFGSQLATTILVATDNAINVGMGTDSSPTFASTIFLTGTFNYATDDNASFTDANHKYFLDNPKAIYSRGDVDKRFNLLDYNFALPYIIAIITAVIMACSIFVFIRRIFDILVLYITSPFFVATRPLDNGQMFKKWQEVLIGKMISSFGIVFSMKLVMLLVPTIMSSNIKFTGSSFGDMLIKSILLIGGVYAAFKSQAMIIEIISPEAARAARESSMMLMATGRKAAQVGAMVGATVATGGAAGAAAAGGAAAGAGGAGAAAGGAGAAASGAGAAGGGAAFTGGMGGSAGGLAGAGGGAAGGAGAAGGSAGGAGAAGGSAGSAGGAGSSAGSAGGSSGGSSGGSHKAITDGKSGGGSGGQRGGSAQKQITDGKGGENKSSAFDRIQDAKDKYDSFNDGSQDDEDEEQH